MLAKQAEQEPKLSSSIEQQQNPKPAVSQMSGAAAAGKLKPLIFFCFILECLKIQRGSWKAEMVVHDHISIL